MSDRIIHLASPGSPCREVIARMNLKDTADLCRFCERAVEGRFAFTADPALLEAVERDEQGGRDDDARRAADLNQAFADNAVEAIVTIRGGAWFTRVLPAVDFALLRRRRTPLHLFGFSEMTSLINVAATYPNTLCHYDMGPGFLYGGMKDFAMRHPKEVGAQSQSAPGTLATLAERWARREHIGRFADFIREVAERIDGAPARRVLRGDWIAGALPRRPIEIVGGNLAALVALTGSPHARRIWTPGRFLALEDVNERLDRIDRMLATLKLAGVFEEIGGMILGDFHKDGVNQTSSVMSLLRYHLPPHRPLPLIARCNFGHIWPLAPAPIGRPVMIVGDMPWVQGSSVRFLEMPGAPREVIHQRERRTLDETG